MSRFLLGLSRFVFTATLLVAPWLFSGRPLPVQVGLALGIGTAYGLWLLGRLLAPSHRSGGWGHSTTVLALVWCGFIALAIFQLAATQTPGFPPTHGVVIRSAPDLPWSTPEILAATQSTALTRTQLARLIWPLVALVLGAQLFAVARYRRGFYLLLALNGTALTIFGIAQRLTWNDKLFWLFPTPHQGQPFASFWNRNHAAGYLNFCLAAAIGLLCAGVRESPREWWPPRSADDRPTWRAALVQLLLLAIPMGVIASASRGGILSAALAFTVLIVLAVRAMQTAIVRMLMTSVVIGSLLAASLGMWQLARARFEGFSLANVTEEGRWRHWSDMFPAWNDVWRTGTGLGTYRYANRPYQNHALSTSYWNADNEYLELAIEGGLPAVVLMMLGGGILLIALRALCRAEWIDEESTADLGPVLAFVVIAQGLQAATDYGISIPANALTGAALLGALTAGRFHSDDDPDHPDAGTRWTWSAGVLGLLLAGAACVSLEELRTAAAADRLLQSVPNLDALEPPGWNALQRDTTRARVEQLLLHRPDDFELHRCLAALHLDVYRRELFTRLQDPLQVEKPAPPLVAWGQTQPAAWDTQCRIWAREGQPEAIEVLRRDPVFSQHVPQAYQAYLQAQRLCPFDAETALNLTYLSYLCGNGQQERSHWLRRAILAAPGEPKRLRGIALITEPVLEDDLAAFCWRRAIELSPDLQDAIYTEAVQRLSPASTLEQVVPPDAASLLRFAEVVPDPLTQMMAADRLTALLKDGSVPAEGKTWVQLGQLAQLQGDINTACDHFRKAVQLEPLSWEFRLRYALALEIRGDIAAAQEQTRDGLRFAPEQPELLKLQQRLESQ